MDTLIKYNLDFIPLSFDELNALLPPEANSLAVFAVYSTETSIPPNLLAYVIEIAKYFDAVILSTTQQLGESGATSLPSNCRILQVSNICHDFGQWFRILKAIPLGRLQKIGLFNNSCRILKPLDIVFATADALPVDKQTFWGLTGSEERAPHVQSFFLNFTGKGVTALLEFAQEKLIDPQQMLNKDYVIDTFEIGLSVAFQLQGIELTCIYPTSTLRGVKSCVNPDYELLHPELHRTNPSKYLWDILLLVGCPILKDSRVHYPNEEEFINTFMSY